MVIRRFPLLAPADDAGGAGGAPAGEAAAASKGLSPDEVNKIFTEREKRFESRFESRLVKLFEERDAAKAAAKAKRKEEKARLKAEQGGAAAGDGKPASGAADDKRVSAEIKRLQTQLVEEKKAREEAEKKRLEQEEYAQTTAALTGAGVANVKGALALLRADQRVARAKDGSVVFRVPRDGYVDELALDEGLKQWLASDEGKFYLPPSGAAGSGATRGAPPAGGKRTKEQLKEEAGATLLNAVLQR